MAQNDAVTVQVVLSREWLLSPVNNKGKAVALMTSKANSMPETDTTQSITTSTLFKCPICEINGKSAMMNTKNLSHHLNDHYNILYEKENPLSTDTRVTNPANASRISTDDDKSVRQNITPARDCLTTPQGKQVTVDNIKRTMFGAERLAYLESAQEALGMSEDEALAKALAESMTDAFTEEILSTTTTCTTATQNQVILPVNTVSASDKQTPIPPIETSYRPVVVRAPHMMIEHVKNTKRILADTCDSHDAD